MSDTTAPDAASSLEANLRAELEAMTRAANALAALEVSCDECCSPAGRGCFHVRGGIDVRAPHPSRIAKARASIAPAPVVGRIKIVGKRGQNGHAGGGARSPAIRGQDVAVYSVDAEGRETLLPARSVTVYVTGRRDPVRAVVVRAVVDLHVTGEIDLQDIEADVAPPVIDQPPADEEGSG